MAETPPEFTMYLEGHDGHRGNVLAHALSAKLQRLLIVLSRLERAYLGGASKRQTDFEVTAANKTNPTTLSLKPVAKLPAYNPSPAFEWGMAQIKAVAIGGVPDDRVRGEIANDLVLLATKESSDAYKSFWINGYAESVQFDDVFLAHAKQIATVRAREDAPGKWHVGVALGSVVGELKKVDDLDGNQEFVVVPRTGPDTITCKFPASLKDAIGNYLFKTVRVSGKLHYGAGSPFPFIVDVAPDGLEEYPVRKPRRTFVELQGVFAGRERRRPNWDSILNG